MNVATFARAAKVQCSITSCNVNSSDWPQRKCQNLQRNCLLSYKVMCERPQHVSQQPRFLQPVSVKWNHRCSIQLPVYTNFA